MRAAYIRFTRVGCQRNERYVLGFIWDGFLRPGRAFCLSPPAYLIPLRDREVLARKISIRVAAKLDLGRITTL